MVRNVRKSPASRALAGRRGRGGMRRKLARYLVLISTPPEKRPWHRYGSTIQLQILLLSQVVVVLPTSTVLRYYLFILHASTQVQPSCVVVAVSVVVDPTVLLQLYIVDTAVHTCRILARSSIYTVKTVLCRYYMYQERFSVRSRGSEACLLCSDLSQTVKFRS